MRAIRELRECRSRGLAPEIGPNDVLIGLNVCRRSLGELLTEVQRNDSIGDRHHQAHVMLTSSMVMPRASRIRTIRLPRVKTSSWFKPPAGSSKRRSFGLMANAR